MKWILGVILTLLLFTAAAFGAGHLIPAHHVLVRSITVRQAPETVFALLADLPNLPTWYHGVKKIEILPPIEGKQASPKPWKATWSPLS